MTVSVVLPLPLSSKYQNQWDYALSAFEVDELYVIAHEDKRPQSNVFKDGKYIDSLAALVDRPLVVAAPLSGRYVQGNISLSEFKHPEDATYYFGIDNGYLYPDQLVERDSLVYIPTDSQHDMYSWVAFSVMMWDRRSK